MNIKKSFVILFLMAGCSFVSKTGEFITSIDFQQNYAEIKPLFNFNYENKKILIVYPEGNVDILRKNLYLTDLLYLDILHVFNSVKEFTIYTMSYENITEKKKVYPVESKYSFYYWFFGNPSSVELFLRQKLPSDSIDFIFEFNVRDFKKGFNLNSSWIEMDIVVKNIRDELIYTGRIKGFYKDVLSLLRKNLIYKK